MYKKASYPVKKVIVHPGYDNTIPIRSWTWLISNDNDIALLEISFPVDLNTFTPVCLNKTKETFHQQIAEVIVYRDKIQRSLKGSVFTSLYNNGTLFCKGVLGLVCSRQNWPGIRNVSLQILTNRCLVLGLCCRVIVVVP